MVNIKIFHKRQIRWHCLSNSSVHDEVVFEDECIDAYIQLPSIPRVDESIVLDGKKKSVKEVIYDCDTLHHTFEINIRTTTEIVYLEYYDYLKTFTHSFDSYKLDSNPSKLEKEEALDYKNKLPETWDEWIRDYNDLKDYSNKNNMWIEKTANRRCEKIYH